MRFYSLVVVASIFLFPTALSLEDLKPFEPAFSQMQWSGNSSSFPASCVWANLGADIITFSYEFLTGASPVTDPKKAAQQMSVAKQSARGKMNDRKTKRDEPEQVEKEKEAQKTAAAFGHGAGKQISRAFDHQMIKNQLEFPQGCPAFGFSDTAAEKILKVTHELDILRRHGKLSLEDGSVMLYWAGLLSSDYSGDFQQTLFYYGNACFEDKDQGLCGMTAQFNPDRYEHSMCFGNPYPVSLPRDTPISVKYEKFQYFRTQEIWLNDVMVGYLRSLGSQYMDMIQVAQECKACTMPVSPQKYLNLTIVFDKDVVDFDKSRLCDGAILPKDPYPSTENGKTNYQVWKIDEILFPVQGSKPKEEEEG